MFDSAHTWFRRGAEALSVTPEGPVAFEGSDAAVQCHAVHDGGHGVFPDAVVDHAPPGIGGQERIGALDIGLVRRSQVG